MRIFKIILLSVLLIVGSFNVNGQHSADSLVLMLDTAKGNYKNAILYELMNYYITNSPEKAIYYANQFLEIAEEIDSLGYQKYACGILGEAYFFMDNLEQSEKYFLKQLEINQKLKDENDIASSYNSLGVVSRNKGELEKALDYYNKSLKIKLKLNDLEGISSSYNNIGVLYEELNLYSQALDYYQRSLEIELTKEDQDGISTSYLNIGALLNKMNKPEKGLHYLQKSIQISDSLGFYITLEMCHEHMANTLEKLHRPKEALQHYKEFNKLKYNRINEENSSRIAKLEIQYGTKKKEEQIENLHRQKKQKEIINYLTISLIFLIGFFLFILTKENKNRRTRNQKLSQQNAEIMQQKEEIEAQRDEIEAQRNEIELQKNRAEESQEKILKQNEDITDSIKYARHIQKALLPDNITMHAVLKEGFFLFLPKDIVSGDFYWCSEIDNKQIIVAADCTGHGVPGAFMSIIGINFLNEIVNENHIVKPDEILNLLRKKVIKTLVHSDRFEFEAKDGMDISVCLIDRENLKLEFAGAYNNLYMIRDMMMDVVKADRMPVGLSGKKIAPYTLHSIDLQKGDTFYMFTDGYADQFGGPSRKKFRITNLRQLLLEIHLKTPAEQKKMLYDNFKTWKDDNIQVDDVLVIGFKI